MEGELAFRRMKIYGLRVILEGYNSVFYQAADNWNLAEFTLISAQIIKSDHHLHIPRHLQNCGLILS